MTARLAARRDLSVCQTLPMGLFRRKAKDPFADVRDEPVPVRRHREHDERGWFEDLPESDVEIEANKGADFTESDQAWLQRDPGEEIRRRGPRH